MLNYKIIVVDWSEGSMVAEKEVDFEEFDNYEGKLFDMYELGEDFKVGGRERNQLWVKDNIVCDQCLDVREEEELANFGGHCSACETAWV